MFGTIEIYIKGQSGVLNRLPYSTATIEKRIEEAKKLVNGWYRYERFASETIKWRIVR